MTDPNAGWASNVIGRIGILSGRLEPNEDSAMMRTTPNYALVKSAVHRCALALRGSRISHAKAGRRLFMAAGPSVILLGAGRLSPAHAQSTDPILQPANPGDAAFIERAFDMRRKAIDLGDQPYGAILVRGAAIIGQSWSRVILDSDPTGHAEMSAIRDAARRSGDRNLSGAVMYSSSRPCAMCEAAANWVGIARMVHGRQATDAGSPGSCR